MAFINCLNHIMSFIRNNSYFILFLFRHKKNSSLSFLSSFSLFETRSQTLSLALFLSLSYKLKQSIILLFLAFCAENDKNKEESKRGNFSKALPFTLKSTQCFIGYSESLNYQIEKKESFFIC